MGKETNVLKSLEESSVSRRSFLKGTAALGAMAAMYGCSKDGGSEIIYGGGNNNNTPIVDETLEETVFMGCSPHNCGGGACGIAAHVAGGRVVRFTTDARGDYVDMIDAKPYTDSQKRGCVRCRSKKQWLYRPDRLLYPLKQTKERGNLSGFKRISWSQAYKEIASELERIKRTYGAETFHKFYATGDGAAYPRSREITANVLWALGGEYRYQDDYSYPSWYHAGTYTWGSSYPGASSASDLKNSGLIVLWSANISEMINSCNSSWYLTQARDMGVPVVSVDQRISKTASMLSTGAGSVPPVITPVGGTDGALIAAILYHLLEKHLESNGSNPWEDSAYLKPGHISKYIHGFFDNLKASETYSYRSEVTEGDYPVAAGGSYSAYIFGDDDRLVQAGLNKAASIYPNQIGYNADNTEFEWYAGYENGVRKTATHADPIFGKYTACYGQIPKTPEWAEKITGVAAQTIRDFAELLAANFNRISLLHCGGFQRNTEGEQGIRALMVLAGVLGCFGLPGATFGNSSNSDAAKSGTLPSFGGVTNGLTTPTFSTTVIDNNIATGINSVSDDSWPIASRYNTAWLTNQISQKSWPYKESTSFPVFMWQDAIEKGHGVQKSRWNVPPITNGPAIKAIFNFGGNCVVNQCGDYNLTTQILTLDNAQIDKAGGNTEDFPNRKYQLELLVTSDYFMTSSCQYSDYVLPAAMAFEKNFYKNVGDTMHFSPKAVDAPGEAKSDFDMAIGIAKALSTPVSITANDIADDGELLKQLYDAPTAGKHAGKSFEEFKSEGLFTAGADTTVTIQWQAFRNTPSTSMLSTPTGKIEAYSQGMVENYEAKGFNNKDTNITLAGSIKTKKETHANGRIVYPIPMYIPLVEGRHACDNDSNVPAFDKTATGVIDKNNNYGATKHPDVLDTNSKGYTYRLHTWHMQYRSHSTLNSNAYLNELYKKDVNGNAAFYSLNRGQDKVYGADAAICDENVYEPVFVSPATAEAIKLPEKGARVVIYNDRGAIYAYAQVSKLVQDGEIMIGQGAWASVIDETFTTPNGITHKIDTGGCANTLTSIRSSRVCQGMTLANDTKVGIEVR